LAENVQGEDGWGAISAARSAKASRLTRTGSIGATLNTRVPPRFGATVTIG
jgi:hypothetical protein